MVCGLLRDPREREGERRERGGEEEGEMVVSNSDSSVTIVHVHTDLMIIFSHRQTTCLIKMQYGRTLTSTARTQNLICMTALGIMFHPQSDVTQDTEYHQCTCWAGLAQSTLNSQYSC